MLCDVTWRKMPLDILTNEAMQYVESQMPKGYEYAPFMFYQAALKKAGDDGEFDLEDGVIFARLMRVPDVSFVFKVANEMAKRRIIYHVQAGSNKCLLADWEYSKGSQPRTLAERRAVVARQIEQKKAMPIIQEEFAPIEAPINALTPENSSFCVYDDKNTKNVVKNVNDDISTENVTKKNSIEREKEREIRERDTHTEREIESVREREGVETSAGATESPATVTTPEKKAVARKNKKAEPQKEQSSDSDSAIYDSSLADEALQSQKTEKVVGNFQEIESVLEAFFLNFSFGYNIKKGRPQIEDLAKRIAELETPEISGPKVAKALCDSFKQMHDEPGTWKDIPLLPLYMAKDSVWSYLLAVVGKKLVKGKKKNTFLEKSKEYEAQADQEREELIAKTDSEYAKYGIDPKDPARFMKLQKVKNAETQSEDVYEGDIF